jgi:pyruvate formate lyase activating enzyme
MIKNHPAKFYNLEKNSIIRCELCPHECKINESKTGICQVRKNIGGKLYSLNYGKISSIAVDPIEKKPLYHFHPEAKVLSFGSWGCNMSCEFCQNWQISQQKPSLKNFSPQKIVDKAVEMNLDYIAYTYSEPVVFYEYMLETAKIAKKEGMKNIMISNGFIKEKPLKELIPFLNAANIDLKAFNNYFYQKHCNGNLEDIKKTIKLLAEEIHLEITTLIVSDLNDDLNQLTELFSWLAEINKGIPLHLSRYHPAYRLNNPSTDIEFMKKAYKTAKKQLDHVYLGNAIIENTSDTFCNNCGERLIKRRAYHIKNNMKANRCDNCGERIYGEFQ